jgi:glycosyltransferase involved in cell wall biosynthesis
MLDFTVAIPTYNGAARLPQVLELLRQQTGTETIPWEAIVIDNNSNDNTAEVVREFQANWRTDAPLRYCLETQQGLAFARQRAIEEAKGVWVGFLDDDNLPAPDWVATAAQFGRDCPQAGAFGGQIHAKFEAPPPPGIDRVRGFLAIRELGDRPWRFEPQNLRLPPGAGLVVRQQAWTDCVPSDPKTVGNVGTTLARGDDYEPLLYLYRAGWEIWYNPAMHLDHCIPPHRLERDYLVELAQGCGLATFQLRTVGTPGWQIPLLFARTLLGNGRRVIRHAIASRKELKTDPIAQCEMAFFWGSLMSPFYWFKKSFLV